MYEATMLLVTLAGIHFMALITPGPDFFLMTQVAVSHSRREALMTVLGVTIGVAIWAIVALLGLHVLVEKFPWIQTILFAGGAMYLTYLGILLIKSGYTQIKAPKQALAEMLDNPLEEGISPQDLPIKHYSRKNLFFKGLFTNLSNPKSLIYFGSVFVIFVGDHISNVMRIEIFSLVVIETFLWFCVVVLLFSLPKLKAMYQRAGGYIDGIAGIFFIGFAMSLFYQAALQLLHQ